MALWWFLMHVDITLVKMFYNYRQDTRIARLERDKGLNFCGINLFTCNAIKPKSWVGGKLIFYCVKAPLNADWSVEMWLMAQDQTRVRQILVKVSTAFLHQPWNQLIILKIMLSWRTILLITCTVRWTKTTFPPLPFHKKKHSKTVLDFQGCH